MQKEIEIKVILTDEQRCLLVSWLEEYAQFVGEYTHKEYYLDNPRDTFFFQAPQGYKDALRYLRVRFDKTGDSICFKSFYVDEKTGKTTHCDEYELNIEDGTKALEFFKAIGYTTQTRVEKIRKTYLFDCFEIVLDDVAELGSFVEVELKKPISSVHDGKMMLYNFLKSVGITSFKEQERGYVSMRWNPGYDFGEETTL